MEEGPFFFLKSIVMKLNELPLTPHLLRMDLYLTCLLVLKKSLKVKGKSLPRSLVLSREEETLGGCRNLKKQKKGNGGLRRMDGRAERTRQGD